MSRWRYRRPRHGLNCGYRPGVRSPGWIAWLGRALSPRRSQPPEPTEPTEVLTIEVPRRLKRALLAEVAERKDDPQRRTVASMKSVILEALTAYGFSEFINRSDIEVQAGIFMKRQAAQLRQRG